MLNISPLNILKLEIWGKFLGTSPSFEVGDFPPKASNFHPQKGEISKASEGPCRFEAVWKLRGGGFHRVPFKEKFGEVRLREVWSKEH